MISAIVIATLGAALLFIPADVLVAMGAADDFETELIRWAGMILVGEAILLARIARKRIRDERWYRVVFAGEATALLAAIYVISGNTFFLVIGFSSLFAVSLRTLMPVLDHWSAEVRGRVERGR